MRGNPGWFPLIGGWASPTRLLSFRYIDGICFREFLLATLESVGDKVMAEETSANPATLVEPA